MLPLRNNVTLESLLECVGRERIFSLRSRVRKHSSHLRPSFGYQTEQRYYRLVCIVHVSSKENPPSHESLLLFREYRATGRPSTRIEHDCRMSSGAYLKAMRDRSDPFAVVRTNEKNPCVNANEQVIYEVSRQRPMRPSRCQSRDFTAERTPFPCFCLGVSVLLVPHRPMGLLVVFSRRPRGV